jgi:lipopolysaccharide/colanic/teichoic acid biosynthesis glycosyltransferase
MLTARPLRRRKIAANPASERAPARHAIRRGRAASHVKRIGDIAVVCLLILFTLPLVAIVALVIKLESAGPVLVREERRVGGRLVRVPKFRITAGAAQRGGSVWPRHNQLSRVGWFLWYTRIVDLPQLLNVLRGEMSLIDSLIDTAAPHLDFFV